MLSCIDPDLTCLRPHRTYPIPSALATKYRQPIRVLLSGILQSILSSQPRMEINARYRTGCKASELGLTFLQSHHLDDYHNRLMGMIPNHPDCRHGQSAECAAAQLSKCHCVQSVHCVYLQLGPSQPINGLDTAKRREFWQCPLLFDGIGSRKKELKEKCGTNFR